MLIKRFYNNPVNNAQGKTEVTKKTDNSWKGKSISLLMNQIDQTKVGIISGFKKFMLTEGATTALIQGFLLFMRLKEGVCHIDDSLTSSTSAIFFTVIAGPLVEEILVRAVLQSLAKRGSKVAIIISHKLCCKKADLDAVERQARTIGLLVSSLGFGLLHIDNPQSVIIQGISSYFFESRLKEKYGFTASFFCHATANAAISIREIFNRRYFPNLYINAGEVIIKSYFL